MSFKSVRLSLCNWKVLLKSVVCQAIIYALLIALCSSLFGGIFAQITDAFAQSGLLDFVNDTITQIASGTFDPTAFSNGVQGVVASFQSAIAHIENVWGQVEWTYALLFVVICLYRVFIAITDVTVECQLDEFATSNAQRPFTWFFVKKQGRAWLFALLQMAYTLVLDLTVVFGCLGFYLLFLVAFNWWTVIPVVCIAILLYSARLTLFAFCLPAVATEQDMSVSQAFKTGLSKVFGSFWTIYWKTLVIVTAIVVIFAVGMLYVNIPVVKSIVSVLLNFILFFLLKNIHLTAYYKADNKPYFYKNIAVEGTEKYNRKHKIVAE